MSDWIVPLGFVAAAYLAYVVIYSALALLFGWPRFQKSDGKELAFSFAMLVFIGIPALMLLDKYFPSLSGWKRGAFLAALAAFVTRAIALMTATRPD